MAPLSSRDSASSSDGREAEVANWRRFLTATGLSKCYALHMDISGTVDELKSQLKEINECIAALEGLHAVRTGVSARARSGPKWTSEQRIERSKLMKEVWKKKKGALSN